MFSRRRFIQLLSTMIPVVVPSAVSASSERSADAFGMETAVSIPCGDWEFCLDPGAHTQPPMDDRIWNPIQVPHTWQALGNSSNYSGIAWYKLTFDAPTWWSSQHVRIEFEAITHTAQVFLNGKAIGQHLGKGYTAFTVDLSAYLNFGQKNTLHVRVDNRPNDRMLPRNKSYDWTDDGGIIRPVNLLITPSTFIEHIEIDAVPDLDHSTAEVCLRAQVRNVTSTLQHATLQTVLRHENRADELISLAPIHAAVQGNSSTMVELGRTTLHKPALWHFDSPHLYIASVELKSALGSHQVLDTFGVRKFESRGSAFFLNGEKVSLIGVERMAGSHPDLGMAETTEWIDCNHRDMKRLNCVFTRTHWPQDRRVLDFCDRHGILFQEEVPAWGSETFQNIDDNTQHALEQNGVEQLREMVTRDRNHPCIVSWGLCNEVDGKNPRSKQFAHVISAEARRLDPLRLQTYASHSLGSDPGADMAGDFDFISTNEYYGSWAPGGPSDVEAHLDRIRKAFPNKPIVVSEYGWCECQPKIMPGDENRVDIIHSHTGVFRNFPEIAGAIYFDYNDYRTLVGDKGFGAMRQRVHGVVDLYGAPKQSFEALRVESSPIQCVNIFNSAEGHYTVEIQTRQWLPAYILRNYWMRWIAFGYDGLPVAGNKISLPDMHPGSVHQAEIDLHPHVPDLRKLVVDIIRPTGFSVITAEHLGS
jgi:beta-galactosidase